MSDAAETSELVPPEFEGKVVVFFVAGMASQVWGERGVVLNYISLREVGGRRFAVGRAVEAVGDEWLWGLQGGIAWDSVAHYLVFDSVEDYKKRASTPSKSIWERFKGNAG